jgi:hypothetical protein
MLKNLLFIATLQLSNLSLSAQEQEYRQLPPFTGIEIESISKVYLRQDSVQSVKVTADHLHNLETTVKNGVLHLDGIPGAEAVISIPKLEKLDISGKGEIIGQSLFTGDKLDLEIGGDGKINLQIQMHEVKGQIAGLGKIVLSGIADHADFAISGSGKVDAMELKVKSCDAEISGLGKCMIDVTDELRTDISGSGSVIYKNPPKSITKNVSGVGKVTDISSTKTKADTTHFTFGESEVYIVGPKDSVKNSHLNWHKKHEAKPIWAGFELGFNNYLNSSGFMSPPQGYPELDLRAEKSISVGFNLLQKNIELGHSNVWFFTGLGITYNNYKFYYTNTILGTSDYLTVYSDTSANKIYAKSKLTCSYIMAPLMFEAFTSRNQKNAFHIGAGAMLGLRVGTHTKIKYDVDGTTVKAKGFGDYNLNPFRYGVRAAIGYGHFNVFADYYFSPMFASGKGPTMYPVNFGITMIGF